MYEFLNKIEPIDESIIKKAYEKWDSIAKPLGSLGKLEEALSRICAIQNTLTPSLKKKAVVIMCADNGVVAEGVTQCGSEVTAQAAKNFAAGKGTVNAFARVCGAEVFPVDIGIKEPVCGCGIIERNVMRGTNNFAAMPAMTREQTVHAVRVGIDIAGGLKDKGFDIIASGEMGIGNTTTASAVLSVLADKAPANTVGRGAGLSNEGLARKKQVIEHAIKLHCPDKNDVTDVLSKVGGLDICGMCGLFLGGGIHRIPVVIDGFISAVAALCAVRMNPLCLGYIFASHMSDEPAARTALDAVGISTYVDCGMRLGEGTGAVMAMKLFDFAAAAFCEAVSFDNTGIDQYVRFDDK